MSWLARSIANTLNHFNKDDENEHKHLPEDHNSPESPNRGVKEDLSDLTKTLTRQFWGISSFISSEHSNDQQEPSDPLAAPLEPIAGIRRDFAEIGGKFRSEINKLSNNIHVSKITKIASSLLQLESDDEEESDGVVGVTDEVVEFAKDIAMRPETWLDFPLLRDTDNEEFELCDVQQEHALAVEGLVPGLGAIRIELCPSYMSESLFWMIYFVLLHSRLEQRDAEVLSTPDILKARATLTHELKNRSNALSKKETPRSNSYSENRLDSVPLEVSAIETCTPTVSTNAETVKHAIDSDEIQIVDKSVIQEEPRDTAKAEDDADAWLKEERSETATSRITIPIKNDEEVSFSDLEDDDDDDGNIPIHYKKATYTSDSSTKEWVQLGRSSTDSGKDSDFSTIDVA